MRYRYLLTDNDNTLMDFHAAEHQALCEALSESGIEPTNAVCERYSAINDSLWKRLERGEITHPQVKIVRFALLLEELGAHNVSGDCVALRYCHFLGTHADLMPYAMAFLESVHKHMKIVLISNGDSVIQRNRLRRCPFTPLLDSIIISSEKGVSKPDPRLVDDALESIGCTDRSEAVLLGDSKTADIPAANRAGIDSIFIDWHGKGCDTATYVTHDLMETEKLLLG